MSLGEPGGNRIELGEHERYGDRLGRPFRFADGFAANVDVAAQRIVDKFCQSKHHTDSERIFFAVSVDRRDGDVSHGGGNENVWGLSAGHAFEIRVIDGFFIRISFFKPVFIR